MRAEQCLRQLEVWLASHEPDWQAAQAFRWRKKATPFGGHIAYLQAVQHPHEIYLSDLLGIDKQKASVVDNTRQFLLGLPANHVLLTGARGTGKSSLVKALLTEFASQGLRLIEVDKADLVELPDIVALIATRPEKFLIFCDDLSFAADDPAYRSVKGILEGSIVAPTANVLVYATSNRRHLMPEYFIENLDSKTVEQEIHPGESVEEKVSLSERFGLWVSFYPFTQDEYLLVVRHELQRYTIAMNAELQNQALQWALQRGSRSGRIAAQFARHCAGLAGLRQAAKNKGAKRISKTKSAR